MINKTSETILLRFLTQNCFRQYAILDLVEKTGLSKSQIYNIIGRLVKKRLVIKSDSKFKANMKNYLAQSFRKMFDIEKIYSLKETGEEILNIYEKIIFMQKENVSSLALVGSISALKHTEKSDIDFLCISTVQFPIEIEQENINFIILTKKEFEKKYHEGEDFILNCIKNSTIIHDNGFFMKFLEKDLPSPSVEQAFGKKKNIEKILYRIAQSIKTKDFENAKEDLKYCFNQMMRIILIKEGILPGIKRDVLKNIKDMEILDCYKKIDMIRDREKALEILEFLEKRLKKI